MDDILAWLGGALAAVAGLLGGILPDFGPQETVFHGYVEARYVYVAPPSAGTIETLPVAEGDLVRAGQTLFVLDTRAEEAALAAARAQKAQAEAELENAQTGQRAEELAITERSLERARSDLALAEQNYERTSQLFEQGVVPRARLDQDHANLMAAQANVDQLEAQLAVGRLPARPAQLEAARAAVAAAGAEVTRLETVLVDRTVTSPVGGRVEAVYYRAGEQAGPSSPVVSVLPEGDYEIRFYVAESERAALPPGSAVLVSCRGCGEPFAATVTWLAADVQYNPPIIYSRREREDLVFLVKATPDETRVLAPGQPVEVRPAP